MIELRELSCAITFTPVGILPPWKIYDRDCSIFLPFLTLLCCLDFDIVASALTSSWHDRPWRSRGSFSSSQLSRIQKRTCQRQDQTERRIRSIVLEDMMMNLILLLRCCRGIHRGYWYNVFVMVRWWCWVRHRDEARTDLMFIFSIFFLFAPPFREKDHPISDSNWITSMEFASRSIDLPLLHIIHVFDSVSHKDTDSGDKRKTS